MMQGRGGRGGRGGGRNPQQQQQPKNRLAILNQYICYRILFYLDEEERKTLSKAYPRFEVKKPTPQQQAKAKAQAQARAKQNNANNHAFGGEVCIAHLEKKEDEVKEEEGAASERKKDDEDDKTKKSTAAVAAASTIADPHTLLARLNTKRLYRRIRHHQKENK
jgi:hypothetical protein